jgi:endonuclease/exonuclease/phosphatase family metal-dependent hydrolase
MRVLTLNLFGRRNGWAARRAALAAGLRRLSPDVVAFQEAIKTEDYDQVVDVLGPGYHLAHQTAREVDRGGDAEDGQGISIASRWPLGTVHEVDLHVTLQTMDYACGALVVEVMAPAPIGPLFVVNHKPSWKLNLEYERQLQAVEVARIVERLVIAQEHHVVIASALDADPEAASVRFWTGRQALERTSVCYRDAWESTHPGEPGETFTPHNPLMTDGDWPFRRIDYILVRCGEHGGPSLRIHDCQLAFDQPIDDVWASDHFGLVADLVAWP